MEIKGNKMGTEPVFKLVITMAVPAMLSMLVGALYNVVDSYFVSKINENALTAVSLAFPIQMLLIAVAVGTGVGINSLVSRRLGEDRKEEADSAATHGILLGIANWVLFAIFGLFFARMYIQAFTNSKEIIEMGTKYLSIVSVFSLGVCIEINIEKTLQATGNMIYPMISQLIGGVTNIIINPILVFGLSGAPKMGVIGSGTATVIGQTLAMLFAMFIIFTKDHAVKINFHHFKINWETVKNIYVVGFPSIIMQAIGSVMVMGMNFILIAFNDTAVAVFGIYFKLQSFIFMPVFGLNQGVMPIMGYNFGARKRQRLISALKIGSVIALCIMAVGTLMFWLFTDQLLLLFSASQQMLGIGVPALRTISLCFIPAALSIMFSTTFQAVGNGFRSLLISVLRQLVVLLPAAYVLSKISLPAVWYAFPIAEIIALIASILFFVDLNRKTLKSL